MSFKPDLKSIRTLHGIWSVSTEDKKNPQEQIYIGTYQGSLVDIAIMLRNEALYTLRFERIIPIEIKPQQRRHAISVKVGIEPFIGNYELSGREYSSFVNDIVNSCIAEKSTASTTKPSNGMFTISLMGADQQKVLCPYCGKPAILTSAKSYFRKYTGQSNWLWLCKPCDAHVLCSFGTTVPLGTLANARLRKMRSIAHELVNTLTKNGKLQKDVYNELAEKLELLPSECHMGRFSEHTCSLAISCLEDMCVEHGIDMSLSNPN